jgi:hypothetical protein
MQNNLVHQPDHAARRQVIFSRRLASNIVPIERQRISGNRKVVRMTTKTNPFSMPEPVSAQVQRPVEKQSASSTAKSSKSQAGSKPVAAPKHPKVDKAELCMVVVPDGDFPTLEIFPNIDALTNRMRALEGQEVSVFPFFGVPVPFTAGPNRFLQLSDGQPHPVFDFSRFGKFVADPQAMLPVDPSYSLAADDLQGMARQSAVIDHRSTVAEAAGGNDKRPHGGG